MEVVVDKFKSNVWSYHAVVPEDYAIKFIRGNNRRVLCTINNDIKIRCALMPSKNGWCILLNKKIRESYGLRIGSSLVIDLAIDDSEFGMDVPDELSMLLDQDEETKRYFDELTPGKQRSLIYIVAKVKNSNSRINKALAISHHLKGSRGELDFKELNVLIKYYNNL